MTERYRLCRDCVKRRDDDDAHFRGKDGRDGRYVSGLAPWWAKERTVVRIGDVPPDDSFEYRFYDSRYEEDLGRHYEEGLDRRYGITEFDMCYRPKGLVEMPISRCSKTHRDLFYAVRGNCACVNRIAQKSTGNHYLALAVALDRVVDSEISMGQNERVVYFRRILDLFVSPVAREYTFDYFRPRILDHDPHRDYANDYGMVRRGDYYDPCDGIVLHRLIFRIMYHMKVATFEIPELENLLEDPTMRDAHSTIEVDLSERRLMEELMSDSLYEILSAYDFDLELEEDVDHHLKRDVEAMHLIRMIFRCRCVEALRVFKECAPAMFGMLLHTHTEELHRLHINWIQPDQRAPWSELLADADNLQFMDRNDIRKLCEFQMKHRGVFRTVFNGFPRTDDGARVAYLNDLDLSKTMAKLDEHKEQIEDGLYLDISTILHRRFKDDAR